MVARRSMLNASLWDIMIMGLSRYPEHLVEAHADALKAAFYGFMQDEKFVWSITYGPDDVMRVRHRFEAAKGVFEKVFNAYPA